MKFRLRSQRLPLISKWNKKGTGPTVEMRASYATHWVDVTLRPAVSRPVRPGVRPRSGPETNFSSSLKFCIDSCGFVILWRPLWQEDGSVIYCCWLASPAQPLSGPIGLRKSAKSVSDQPACGPRFEPGTLWTRSRDTVCCRACRALKQPCTPVSVLWQGLRLCCVEGGRVTQH
jgi:hypothetical protein